MKSHSCRRAGGRHPVKKPKNNHHSRKLHHSSSSAHAIAPPTSRQKMHMTQLTPHSQPLIHTSLTSSAPHHATRQPIGHSPNLYSLSHDSTSTIPNLSTPKPSPSSFVFASSHRGPYTHAQRFMAKQQKRNVPARPHQIKLNLKKKVETALQLGSFKAPTASKSMQLNKITHLERHVQTKIDWLTDRLQTPSKFWSLHQIQDIYHTFLEVRFACPIEVWQKVMKLWSDVANFPHMDPSIKKQAHTITMSLLDELVKIEQLGTYNVMKAKQYDLPQHLLKFNIRPTNPVYAQAMKTMMGVGNFSGALDIFRRYQKDLDGLPNVQYLPPPILPPGPEREQEFVRRRLIASRREELQHSPFTDQYAMRAALKTQEFDFADELMAQISTERGYEAADSTHADYLRTLLSRGQYIAAIEMFKRSFQSTVPTIDFDQSPISRSKSQIKSHTGAESTATSPSSDNNLDTLQEVQQRVLRDLESRNVLHTSPSASSTADEQPSHDQYSITSIGPFDPSIPAFIFDQHLVHPTFSPSRKTWLQTFKAIAAMHPLTEESTTSTDPSSLSSSNNELSQSTELSLVNTTHDNNLRQFVFNNETMFDKDSRLRKHVYAIAKQKYGLSIDKSFFLPMIKEAPTFEAVVAYMNDFHEELEDLRQKSRKEPWTEAELKQKQEEEDIKRMLIIDLNVETHQHRFEQLFGRYAKDALALGYDEDFYAALQTRFMQILVDASLNDRVEDKYVMPHYDAEGNRLEDDIDESSSDEQQSAFTADHKIQNIASIDTLHAKYSQKRQSKIQGEQLDDEVDELSDDSAPSSVASSSSSSLVPLYDQHGNSRISLYKSPVIKQIEGIHAQDVHTLLSAATRQNVRNVLTAVQTTRLYQDSYGLPVSAATESTYLRSLIFMSRRNEEYPPLLNTNNASLIKYDIAAYTPVSDTSNSKDGKLPLAHHPLVNFRDRIQYINQSLLRRESVLQMCFDQMQQIIDSLGTMRNEMDANLQLKQVNLKTLSDFVEAYSELAVDASALRGPFASDNIFIFNSMRANQIMRDIANGIEVPGMKTDANGNKFVPGITEPAPHQVDHVDIKALNNIAQRIGLTAYASMKRALQVLLDYADGMTLHQVQHIPMLSGSLSMFTEQTYLPLLRALSAHGDYTNVLLLIESAHQHRGVVPTANMLNHAAIAFINSDKPRHAAGVLDIMLKASDPSFRHHKSLSEHDLQRAVVHGTAHELIDKLHEKLERKVYPNATTISLLLHMYKEQGMLDHVEEFWRRMVFHDDSSWTSFSSVEEQKLVSSVLAAELDGTLVHNRSFDAIHGTVRGEAPDLSLQIEDAYDSALNPKKNTTLKQVLLHNEIKKSMKSLLRNRNLPSVLPEGAHRTDIPDQIRRSWRLDSTTSTVMMQTFIQLGHPMHALQIYLDMRQAMPVFPTQAIPPSAAFQRAIEINQAHHRMYPSVEDPLTSIISPATPDMRMDADLELENDAIPHVATKHVRNLVDVLEGRGVETSSSGVVLSRNRLNLDTLTPRGLADGSVVGKPVSQHGLVSERALVNVHSPDDVLRAGLHDQSAQESLKNHVWPEIDAIASLALYAFRKSEKFILSEELNPQNLPQEIFSHAHILQDVSQQILHEIKDYTIAHPYLPADISSTSFYSHPRSTQNVITENAGLHLSQPRLLLPLTTQTEPLYALIDSLVYSDIALEETVFKVRYQKLAPIGMKRWFTIFPTMINQCKSIYNLKAQRDDIIDQVDNLRDDIQELITVGARAPKPLLGLRDQYKDAQSVARAGVDMHPKLQNAKSKILDRGISHPSTKSILHADLPAAKLPAKDALQTKGAEKQANLLQSFQQFLAAKGGLEQFKKPQVTSPPPSASHNDNPDMIDEPVDIQGSVSPESTPAQSNPRNILHELQQQIKKQQHATTSAPASPLPGSFKVIEEAKQQQTGSQASDFDDDLPSHVSLPEVASMKKHLRRQSQLQKEALRDFQRLRQTESATTASQLASGVNLLHSLHNLHPELNHTFETQTMTERHNITSAEWLTPATDLTVARDIAQRKHRTSQRQAEVPGLVKDTLKSSSPQSHLVNVLSQDSAESKTLPKRRPGGVLTSPYGPETTMPAEQFRAPSTMARLANTPDTQIPMEKLALSTERVPFKLATHGVAMSDRPGIPTQLSQEYLEKYVMGLPADPKNKYSQRRHNELDTKFENVMVDPSFIRAGSQAEPIAARDMQKGGYGQGYHSFKSRTQEKSQEVAFQQRQALLNEFNDDMLQAQKDRAQMTKAEREKSIYSDLFEIGDNANLHNSGAYSMLSASDQQRREMAIQSAAFNSLDAMLAPKPSTSSSGAYGEADFQDLAKTLDFDIRHNKSQAKQASRPKEVVSSAAKMSLPTNKAGRKKGFLSDPFGLKSRNKNDDPNRSTLFD